MCCWHICVKYGLTCYRHIHPYLRWLQICSVIYIQLIKCSLLTLLDIPFKGVIGYSQNRGFSYAFIYFLTNRSAVCPLNIYRYQLFFIFLIFIMALSRHSGIFRSLFDLLTIFQFSMCKKVPKKALFWPF